MRVKRFWNSRRNLVFIVVILSVMLFAILAGSFSVSSSIGSELRSNAYDSLMNASEIIRVSLDSHIRDDLSQLHSFGRMLKSVSNEELKIKLGEYRSIENMHSVSYADITGAGINDKGESFNISELPVKETALSGEEGISTGFTGSTGQQHMILQSPIFDDGKVVGAVYGEVVATKYYSEDLFSFRDGEGRASLFNKSDGTFVIKAPQTELTHLKSDSIFDAIRQSGNDEKAYDAFRAQIAEGSKSIMHLQYGSVNSYVAILPLRSNSEMYIATIMSRDALQVEADSISRLIFIMQCILIIGLSGLIALAVMVIYRMMKEEQARKTREIEQRSREELTEALVKAQDASVAKTRFLSNMSHDIRTPMNAIIGMTTIAAQSIGDEEKLRGCLSVIASSSRHLLDLINDILDMSKIESGTQSLAKEPFAMPAAANSIISIISSLCRAKDQSFTVEFRGIEHEYLIGDRIKVNQVIMNLLNNASKFTPIGGSVRLEIEELPNDKPDVALLEIKVIDTGIGIAEENLEAVYDPFFRSENANMNSAEGTGLGLPIAKNIVTAMGGTIELQSVLGEGTTFTVTIPFPIASGECLDDLCPDMKGKRALVVMSDCSVADSARRYLCDIGMTVDRAFSVSEASDMLASRNGNGGYWIAMVDMEMDEGVQAIKLIREAGASIRIIALSGSGVHDAESYARAAGANAILSRPLFRSAMYEVLRSVSDRDATGSQPRASLSGRRILLVEDHPINQEVAKILLEKAGASVDVAKNGQDGVDKFMASDIGYYDVILMDIQMPVMNGYEAAAIIRASGRADAPKTPIVALTANAFAEDYRRAFEAGMNAHLSKPIEPKAMYDTLRQFCNSGRDGEAPRPNA